MKNPNKFGTCYKLSGKRRKPWIARAYIRTDQYGKSVYKTIGTFKTKTEGQKALMEYNLNPYNLDSKKLTFEALFTLWSSNHRQDIKKTTFQNNYVLSYNLLKDLHGKIFGKLRPQDYQSIIDELSKDHSREYLKKIRSLLKHMYEYAMLQDICTTDYSAGLKIRGYQSAEQDYFTDLEVKKIQQAVGVVDYADMVLFLCYTGLRPQELFNLTKFNIDFENKLITGVGVKTKAGRNKKIVILNVFQKALEERYNNTDDYIFKTQQNKQLYYAYFLHIYRKCLSDIGIHYKSPKSCRHYFATLVNEKGVNSKVIETAMGHTSVDFTKKKYTHTQDQFLKEEMSKIDVNI